MRIHDLFHDRGAAQRNRLCARRPRRRPGTRADSGLDADTRLRPPRPPQGGRLAQPRPHLRPTALLSRVRPAHPAKALASRAQARHGELVAARNQGGVLVAPGSAGGANCPPSSYSPRADAYAECATVPGTRIGAFRSYDSAAKLVHLRETDFLNGAHGGTSFNGAHDGSTTKARRSRFPPVGRSVRDARTPTRSRAGCSSYAR